MWAGDDLKASNQKVDNVLGKLKNMTKTEASASEVKRAIQFVTQIKDTLNENQTVINRFLKYTYDNKGFLVKKNLNWISYLQEFYTNKNVTQCHKILQTYLNHFETYLKYILVNYYFITEYKTKKHIQNYDSYYMKCRNAVSTYTKFNIKRIYFLRLYLEKYPEIKPYLPNERYVERVKKLNDTGASLWSD